MLTVQRADSRIWMEVDLGIAESNFKKILERVHPLKIMAVLKANAYGLGVLPLAEVFSSAGAAGFCTATLEEAMQLKSFGKPVQILGALLDFELPDAVRNHFILGITGLENAEKISRESVRQGVVTEVHFKIDTGMGRLGILAKDALETAVEVMKLPNLKCCGIYTHFPAAADDYLTKCQVDEFLSVIKKLESAGVPLEKKHAANSDAVNSCPFAACAPFTHVRAGIDLHGGFSPEGRKTGLSPVLSLKTRVVQVRKMPAGHTIGYNRTCRLPVETEVATVACGYADGIPLSLSNRGYVLIRGRYCPVIGRISMDYATVRLDGFAPGEIQPGEVVICIGTSGDSAITVEDWAQIKGTHPYEILCSVSPRVKRIYVRSE